MLFDGITPITRLLFVLETDYELSTFGNMVVIKDRNVSMVMRPDRISIFSTNEKYHDISWLTPIFKALERAGADIGSSTIDQL